MEQYFSSPQSTCMNSMRHLSMIIAKTWCPSLEKKVLKFDQLHIVIPLRMTGMNWIPVWEPQDQLLWRRSLIYSPPPLPLFPFLFHCLFYKSHFWECLLEACQRTVVTAGLVGIVRGQSMHSVQVGMHRQRKASHCPSPHPQARRKHRWRAGAGGSWALWRAT